MVNEVLKEQDKDNPSFQVVQVDRQNVAALRAWPVTGWSGAYHWLSANRGPSGQIIRPGDLINLVIWDNQENSLLTAAGTNSVEMSGLLVSPSGEVFVPYLNEVLVSGMRPDEARHKIQKALWPIAPDAQVQLIHRSGSRNSVDLVSGVVKPGSYPLAERNVTILSVLAQAGGVLPSLRYPLVRLIRSGKTYEIRAEDLMANASKNVILRGDDKVLVKEDDRYFTSLGATGTEQLVYFTKEHITALEAMSLIGGLSDARANPKGVLILRDYSPGQLRQDGKGPELPQVIFALDLTSADGLFAARKFEVNPGDTVLATESPVTTAQTILGLMGRALGLGITVNNNT